MSKPPRSSRPSWAVESARVGTADDSTPLTVQVHLALRSYQQLVDLVYAVGAATTAPLTEAQFLATYAPTDAAVQAVRAHFEASGLTVSGVAANHLYLTVTGKPSAVGAAFSTQIGVYSHAGTAVQAPMTAPTLPASVSPYVAGVLGLSTSPAARPMLRTMKGELARASASFRHGQGAGGGAADAGGGDDDTDPGCATYWNEDTSMSVVPYGDGYPNTLPHPICGYAPGQIRSAYGVDGLVAKKVDGTGVALAILDAWLSPTLLAEAQTYAAAHDAAHPLVASQLSFVAGPPSAHPLPLDTGWYEEQTLDLEAIHTIAPGASIVALSASTDDPLDMVAASELLVSQGGIAMISNSWGGYEAQANDYVVWQQHVLHAGAKGIGIYFATGDDGDLSAYLSAPSAGFPASLPHVTAVGGTSLAIGAKGERLFEAAWETGLSSATAEYPDGGAIDPDAGYTGPSILGWVPPAPGAFLDGSGGAVSVVYAQPRYQNGVVPSAMADLPGAPARVTPDVAMVGDPDTGMLIGFTDADATSSTYGQYVETPAGGTSLACPLFAGMMTLAQQHAGRALGFSNAQLYAARTSLFRDIVPPASPLAVSFGGDYIETINPQIQTIKSAVGYDDMTGIGSPAGAAFVTTIK